MPPPPPPSPTQPLDRFKQATIHTVRALAERRDVVVGFAGSATSPETTGSRAHLPAPDATLSAPTRALVRGAADLAGLRLRHHDEVLHETLRPGGSAAPDTDAVFDALEETRVEALGARQMPGVALNLAARLARLAQEANYPRATTTADMPRADAVRFLVREALTGDPPPPAAVTAVDLWRPTLAPVLAPLLPTLVEALPDQRRYAHQVNALLHALSPDTGAENTSAPAPSPPDEPPPPEPDPPPPDEPEDTPEPDTAPDLDTAPDDLTPEETVVADSTLETETPDTPAQDTAPAPPRLPDTNPPDLHNLPGYTVFTRTFDETVNADSLADPDELALLRDRLDRQLQPLRGTIARLANRLQRKLLARQQRHWDFDLEEGLLDSARLARVVANPLLSLSFKQERETDFRDTVVTLLMDNSGSMRGRPIATAALCADILARTLERCGVKVEILGFTTRTWKGGRARDLWSQQGRPVNPGRLNELRHVIYKAADAPMRRARRGLALMLRESLLKENIDGEALVWAHQRLLARPEQRRILMVISDGAPVDDATLATNHGLYLEHHLRAVIRWIETRSPVELVAIGIGHDVTRYYHRAVTITDPEQLGGTLLHELTALFGTSCRRAGT